MDAYRAPCNVPCYGIVVAGGVAGSRRIEPLGRGSAGRGFEFAGGMESFPQRPLGELLHEQQEPFMLREFLTQRQHLCRPSEGADGGRVAVRCSRMANSEPTGSVFGLRLADSARSHGSGSSPLRSPVGKVSCAKSPSAGAARLLEAAVRILEPGLPACSRPRSSFSIPPAAAHVATTVRYLLEMERRASSCSGRSRKRLRKKTPVKAQLGLSEESNFGTNSPNGRIWRDCASSAGANFRGRASPQEAALNALQRASEALIGAFRLAPGKCKKAGKARENVDARLAQKRAGYTLLKSILRRLSPAREPAGEASGKVRCRSERIESGVQGANATGCISKRFSNAMRSFSKGGCRQELQGNGEVRIRVRDIVRWGSFDESEGRDGCFGLPAEKCSPLERPAENFAEVISERRLSAEAETGHAKMEVASRRNKENWQAFLKRREYASSDFSTTSSSSAWLESCVDSDSGSTSLDLLSSNGSSDSRELKGIDLCALEALSPRGYLSLEVDENGGVKDFHHSPRCDVGQPLCDMGCDQMEDIATSDAILEPDCLHCCPSSLPRGLGTLQISDDKGSPVNFVSRIISPICGEAEDEAVESIPCIGDDMSYTSRHGCNQSDGCEAVSEAGCFDEVEQLSPVSVLDSPFEEESLGFEETLANIQRAKQQLLQKICEYERLAHMDTALLENRMASWKEEPSEDEADSSCAADETQRMNTMAEHPEMDWEEGDTEEYVREVLNCSQTISEDLTSLMLPWGCLDHRCSYVAEDLNDNQMQVSAGSCYMGSHSHLQGLKGKQPSGQVCRLVVDRVNEELQSAGRCYGNGFMAELWLREQLGPEQLAKKICGQILAWKQVGPSHTDKLVELDLNRRGGEWSSFRKEAEEIGAKIELAIFGVLVEEVLVDLAHFYMCKDTQIIGHV